MPEVAPQSTVAPPTSSPRALVLAALLAAASLMMAVTGYSFLAGNHEVYLLEPLRRAGLASFENDWFVTQTLQYHGLFATIAGWLFQLDVARPAFLAIYLILLLSTAWAWWRIVRALGGDVIAYLVSVVLYHLLLGDRALGFYSLLQDGQFNAGNVAAVALLVGIAMWIEGRALWAGLAFGLAGAFHLNYAVVAPGLWVVLLLWQRLPAAVRRRPETSDPPALPRQRLAAAATAVALLPSLVNVGFALPSKLGEREEMAFDRFIDLYVHLRHPHHYDPLAWPWWVWAAFLAPIPLAVLGWRRWRGEAAWDEAARIWLILMGLQLFALLTAGVFYLSETFVQLSLWRFSPHAKVLAVSAAAVWLVGRRSPASDTLENTAGNRTLIPIPTPGATACPEGQAVLGAGGERRHGLPFGTSRGTERDIATTSSSRGFRWELGNLGLISACMLTALVGCTLVVFEVSGITKGHAALLAAASLAIAAVASVAWGNSSPFPELLVVPLVFVGALAWVAIRGLPPPGQPRPTPAFVAASAWARDNASPAALFLLPPDASAFSVNARRGQTVSFKLVPQLSGELIEWDERLRAVLDVPDLTVYIGGVMGYRRSQEAMRRRYDELPSEHLFEVARRYGARYVFRSAEDPEVDPEQAVVVWRGEAGTVLYDLGESDVG